MHRACRTTTASHCRRAGWKASRSRCHHSTARPVDTERTQLASRASRECSALRWCCHALKQTSTPTPAVAVPPCASLQHHDVAAVYRRRVRRPRRWRGHARLGVVAVQTRTEPGQSRCCDYHTPRAETCEPVWRVPRHQTNRTASASRRDTPHAAPRSACWSAETLLYS